METITGEVRRIKVRYFHRHGRGTGGGVEQPHLFCAYHSSSNDLLKGSSSLPIPFLGSSATTRNCTTYLAYTRYKMGYIWQDVLDDDLVMPISRNEYVLQGCEKVALSSSVTLLTFMFFPVSVYHSWIESCLCNDEASAGNNVSSSREEIRDKYPHSSQTESPTLLQQCPLPSSDTSTLTIIKSVHLEDDEKHSGVSEPDNHSHCNISFKFGLLRKKNTEKCERITGGMARTPVSSVSTLSSAQAPLTESKTRYKGASQKFRNLITCGATDTNDAVLVEKNTSLRQDFNIERSSQIWRADGLGGSRRTSNTYWGSGKGQQEPRCHPCPFVHIKEIRNSCSAAGKAMIGSMAGTEARSRRMLISPFQCLIALWTKCQRGIAVLKSTVSQCIASLNGANRRVLHADFLLL
ncbi:hypothetical protein EUGRSUZ_G03420 [Eucalyptus grandis]|uniref:Uncharacterized protein n=2 Tax=Eucalyptus grandis TaxID=71139 RepID=A0ACC3KA12_EUCGR|nr:hypothetical protein EUGRSUZ_G03420 [Eucalyptus grandis]